MEGYEYSPYSKLRADLLELLDADPIVLPSPMVQIVPEHKRQKQKRPIELEKLSDRETGLTEPDKTGRCEYRAVSGNRCINPIECSKHIGKKVRIV